ncbi:uncharacterized protein LOC107271290 isoform X2 [Cephus cinctus]|uniref:ascorbate ferrireductase (transmembrane) n=1 Tax=Cephus cinctus TaxID=211228 RepID=A0AAJ7C5T9_CEPCN|nr:uncharacterized protein LOC107271290 isoform X2 [Cephus cinctus]
MATDETSVENTSVLLSLWNVALKVLNFGNHILLFTLAGYLIYISWGTGVWSLHVLLCSVGYVLLMGEGIVVLAGENLWSGFLSRRVNSHIHWVLLLVGSVFSIVGTAYGYHGNALRNRPHFSSTHGLTGIISVGLVIIAAVLGLPALFAGKLRNIIKPIINKFSHNLLGTASFVVGMVSQCYGYNTGFMRRLSPEIREACYYSTIIVTILCLTGVAKSGTSTFYLEVTGV